MITAWVLFIYLESGPNRPAVVQHIPMATEVACNKAAKGVKDIAVGFKESSRAICFTNGVAR